MRRYAEDTSVPVERSRTEIEKELGRFGAEEFGFLNRAGVATFMFKIKKYTIRIELSLPEAPQEQRARFRALLLVIKAKLVAVRENISTIEREFLADVVGPDGRTVMECVKPQLGTGKALMLGVGNV